LARIKGKKERVMPEFGERKEEKILPPNSGRYKKMYEEKKVADPFIAGFYESMAKTNTEKITKEIMEDLSKDSNDSDDFDVESGDEDSEDRP
jgi:hypothetical protein